ncbi:MAG: hypothetical protein KKE20_06735 [Nanoarchaeota archaeon]|nr:hypothetical protein [Nanoarchaeota archaeon]
MVLDKLKFWKRESPLQPLDPPGSGFGEPNFGGFGKEHGMDTGFDTAKDSTPGLGGTGDIGKLDEFGSKTSASAMDNPEEGITMKGPSYERPQDLGEMRHAPLSPREYPASSAQAQVHPKDLEIMSAKIDAIKANVESINHRLESIERILMAQEKNKRYQW